MGLHKYEESTESEIVDNYVRDTLYTHQFKNGAGKFFTVVSSDDNGVPDAIEFEHPERVRNKIKTTFTFIKESNEIKSISVKRFKYYKKTGYEPQEEQITFSYGFFKQIIGYMQMISALDLGSINERKISLNTDNLPTIDEDTKKKITTLLMREDGHKIIEELLSSGIITSNDIVNIGYRKSKLEIFRKLLEEDGYVDKYKTENNIKQLGAEAAWQHFFEENNWIFGYGLDYRFLSILQREVTVSGVDMSGKEAAVSDFLLGCNKFTVLVELKKPDTELYGRDKNRSNAWKLSDDLTSALSQILEQKASLQVKAESDPSSHFDDIGKPIKQKSYDPKAILVIGHSRQFGGENKEALIKAKTFELFRRDSRNIEIITYDELYERAKFIVESSKNETIPSPS